MALGPGGSAGSERVHKAENYPIRGWEAALRSKVGSASTSWRVGSLHTMISSTAKSLLAAVALGAAFMLNNSQAAVASGQPAPDFTVTDLDGKTHRLADYRGRVVVLEWLNPGCPFVVRHYKSGNMQSTQKAAATDRAVWLQVNSGSIGDLDAAKSVEWQTKQGVTATAYIRDVTGKLGRLFDAKTTPHLFVIGKDGTLVYQGAIDDQPNASVTNTTSAHNYVKAALAALRAGKPVETTSTPSYGCGVKYGAEGRGPRVHSFRAALRRFDAGSPEIRALG